MKLEINKMCLALAVSKKWVIMNQDTVMTSEGQSLLDTVSVAEMVGPSRVVDEVSLSAEASRFNTV